MLFRSFLLDKKPDSKDVKTVFAEIEQESARPEPPKKKAKEPEPVKATVVETKKEPEPPASERKKNNQASLFDF